MVNQATVASPHSSGSPAGIQPQNEKAWVTTRIAVVAGDIVMFDLLQSDGDVSNNTIGDAASGLTNVTTPATAGLAKCIFGIALTSAAADTTVQVLVKGYHAAAKTDGGVALGDLCVAANGVTTLDTADGADGETVIARALAVDGGSPTTSPVIFNGYGFGKDTA